MRFACIIETKNMWQKGHGILEKSKPRERWVEHGRGRPWQSRQSRGLRARWGSCVPSGGPHRQLSRQGQKSTSKKSWGALTGKHQQYPTCIYREVWSSNNPKFLVIWSTAKGIASRSTFLNRALRPPQQSYQHDAIFFVLCQYLRQIA